MRFTIQLVTDPGDATFQTREIVSIDRLDGVLSNDDLGLTLGEAKAMLAALQVASRKRRSSTSPVASGPVRVATGSGG
ncbi:hypothetical protein ACWGS9_28705 [Bradyrhizobium sp. Arg314]